MHTEQRTLLRVAAAVERRLARYSCPLPALPSGRWSHLQALGEQAAFCRQRGMAKAEERVRLHMRWYVGHLHKELVAQITAADEAGCRVTCTAGDIYRDLVAIKREFGGMECDLREGMISVTTQPIVLHDVPLGPFRIELDYKLIGATDSYRVIATRPNTACGNPGVTHPHIRSDSLCEGKGWAAISASLRDGRLYDFFLLVSQVLNYYNPHSAFADLSAWEGVECQECGSTVDRASAYYCVPCGRAVCGNCGSICAACREELCSGCASACAGCGRTFCHDCLENGSVGHATVCTSGGNCGQRPTCHSATQETDDDETRIPEEAVPGTTDPDTDPTAACGDTDVAIQPDRLGEVALLA